jgi:hypothetical protein
VLSVAVYTEHFIKTKLKSLAIPFVALFTNLSRMLTDEELPAVVLGSLLTCLAFIMLLSIIVVKATQQPNELHSRPQSSESRKRASQHSELPAHQLNSIEKGGSVDEISINVFSYQQSQKTRDRELPEVTRPKSVSLTDGVLSMLEAMKTRELLKT